VTLLAGQPTGTVFTTPPPSAATNGVPLSPQPVVQLVDFTGNPSTVAGVDIEAGIQGGDGASLKGTTKATTNDAGQATYADLELSGAAGIYTLAFAAGGLPDLLSGPIELAIGAPTTIVLTTQPSSTAQNDAVFATQPVVAVTDAAGNALAGITVTATIASAPPGTSTLGGTLTATTDVSGAPTFTDLELVGPIGSYTLLFSAGSISVTSNTITLQAGAGTGLFITVQPPRDALPLIPLLPAPKVEIRDTGGNPVPADGVTVSAAVSQGNGSLAGTTTDSTTNGVATFSLLWFTLGSSGSHRITFSSPGLTSATSDPPTRLP
jgi:hypothetical protein